MDFPAPAPFSYSIFFTPQSYPEWLDIRCPTSFFVKILFASKNKLKGLYLNNLHCRNLSFQNLAAFRTTVEEPLANCLPVG